MPDNNSRTGKPIQPSLDEFKPYPDEAILPAKVKNAAKIVDGKLTFHYQVLDPAPDKPGWVEYRPAFTAPPLLVDPKGGIYHEYRPMGVVENANTVFVCGQAFPLLAPYTGQTLPRTTGGQIPCRLAFDTYRQIIAAGDRLVVHLDYNDLAPRRSDDPTYLDLSDFAQPQFNQQKTSTCLFNSSTAVAEILINLHRTADTKPAAEIDLSEPYMVGAMMGVQNGPKSHIFWVERLNGLKLLLNEALPTEEVYRVGSSFDDVRNLPTRRDVGGDKFVKLPKPLKSHKIFWRKLKWYRPKKLDRVDVEAIVTWMGKHRSPVQLHRYVGNIWHVAVLIGFDTMAKKLLLKDTLGEPEGKGVWRSYSWFEDEWTRVYGANGVALTEQ